jgi:hypothetical protein
MSEPWDVPESPEGREKLRNLVEEYRASGQMRELGLSLTKLASLVKQIGTGTDDGAFTAGLGYAAEAIQYLRATEDRRSLATVLRVGAGFTFGQPPADEWLAEAKAISVELGDTAGEGWALFASSAWNKESHDELLDQAKERFWESGDLQGVAAAEVRQGVSGRDYQAIVRGAEIYESLGLSRRAEESFAMAAQFGSDDLSLEQQEQLLLRSVDLAQRRGAVERLWLYYNNLERIFRSARRTDEAKKYKALKSQFPKPKF